MRCVVKPVYVLCALTILFWCPGLAQAEIDMAAMQAALEQLSAYQYGHDSDVLNRIDEAIVHAHSDPRLKSELEASFIAMLQSDASVACKSYLCRKLMHIGTKQSAPVLGELLKDPDLSHMARFALERMPYPMVDTILLEALATTQGAQRVGLIDSLRSRTVAAATPRLIALLESSDAETVEAVVAALGVMGTDEAAQAVQALRTTATGPLKKAVVKAELRIAEGFLTSGQLAKADRIYRSYDTDGSEPHIRLASLRGRLSSEAQRASERLVDALNGDDALRRGFAASIVAHMPTSKAAHSCAVALKDMPPAGQVALVDALAIRGERFAGEYVRPLLKSPHLDVRVSSITALGAIGDKRDVIPLAAMAAKTSPEARHAVTSLVQMKGEGIEKRMSMILPDVSPAARAQLINVLVLRNAPVAMDAISPFLSDDDASVRLAAIEALGGLGRAGDVRRILDALSSAEASRERQALEKALVSLCSQYGQACTAPMVAAYHPSRQPLKRKLLSLFHLLESPAALKVVKAELNSDDPDTRDVAIRTLADWPNDLVLEDLFRIARDEERLNHRVLAFRGYVRLVDRMSEAPDALRMTQKEKADLLMKVAQIAERPEEQKLVLGGLGKLRGSRDAMAAAQHFLDSPETADEACMALINIMGRLDSGHSHEAKAVLERMLQATDDARIVQRIQSQMDRLEDR